MLEGSENNILYNNILYKSKTFKEDKINNIISAENLVGKESESNSEVNSDIDTNSNSDEDKIEKHVYPKETFWNDWRKFCKFSFLHLSFSMESNKGGLRDVILQKGKLTETELNNTCQFLESLSMFEGGVTTVAKKAFTFLDGQFMPEGADDIPIHKKMMCSLSNSFLKFKVPPMDYNSIFYCTQNMDKLHLVIPGTDFNSGGSDYFQDCSDETVPLISGKGPYENKRRSSRFMVACFYNKELLDKDESPTREDEDFYLAINDILDTDSRNKLQYILWSGNAEKLNDEQNKLKNKILGKDDNSKEWKASIVTNWKKSFEKKSEPSFEGELDNDGNVKSNPKPKFKCDRRQLTFIMHAEDKDLSQKQKDFRDKYLNFVSSGFRKGKDQLVFDIPNDYGDCNEVTEEFNLLKGDNENLKLFPYSDEIDKLCSDTRNIFVESFFGLSRDEMSSLLKDYVDANVCFGDFPEESFLKGDVFESNKEKFFGALYDATKARSDFAVYATFKDNDMKRELIKQFNFGALTYAEMKKFVCQTESVTRIVNKNGFRDKQISLMGLILENAIKEGNVNNIFALLAVMSKQNNNPNIDYYALIPEGELKNQALNYRDRDGICLYVKPYVVSAVIVPLAGFGTVGFGIYLNFAKSVPNILNSMANGVKNASPIVSILVAVAIPAASSVASYFLGEKAKQNSKTNRDNKDNIDGIRKELNRNQENIK